MYLLNVACVPGTALGAEDVIVKLTEKILAFDQGVFDSETPRVEKQ